jgi:hypothetical protein
MPLGDLNRLLKAAKANGFMVEIQGDVVRLLPTASADALPSAESAAQKALAAWRRSA